jgi:hypothetical protein
MGFDIFVLCRALLLLNQSGNGKSRSLGRSGREFGEPIFGRLFDSQILLDSCRAFPTSHSPSPSAGAQFATFAEATVS